MRVLPILFNTEMVKAILDGRKSCTRRIVKPQPKEKTQYPLGYVSDSTDRKNKGRFAWGIDEYGGSLSYAKPQFCIDGILYVRETWYADGNCILYKADNEELTGYRDINGNDVTVKWHPSIHMPKEATRIWLNVKDVRVERLKDISGGELLKEGIDKSLLFDGDVINAFDEFKLLWDSTIKKSDLDTYGWSANPWVWVIELERCEKPKLIVK